MRLGRKFIFSPISIGTHCFGSWCSKSDWSTLSLEPLCSVMAGFPGVIDRTVLKAFIACSIKGNRALARQTCTVLNWIGKALVNCVSRKGHLGSITSGRASLRLTRRIKPFFCASELCIKMCSIYHSVRMIYPKTQWFPHDISTAQENCWGASIYLSHEISCYQESSGGSSMICLISTWEA